MNPALASTAALLRIIAAVEAFRQTGEVPK